MLKRRKNGTIVDVDPQVIRWQKSLRTFRRYKKLIIQTVLWWHGGDVSQAEVFLKQPNKDLGGMAPKQFFNPKQIKRLWIWVNGASSPKNNPNA